MKKAMKFIIPLFLILFISQSLVAQSLQDNEYYRKSVNLKRQSEIAFDEGDYVEAKRLAEESKKYALMSDEWIAMMLSRYKANSALRRFETSINSANNINGAVNFPEEWAEAQALYEEAYQQFRSEEYDDSYATSLKGIEVLTAIVYIPREGGYNGPWPAKYVVQKLPSGSEDCIWNIAGYDFIYGDNWAWKRIWEANEDKLPEPGNPRLIHPGMVLDIPAKDGETRSGTWENGVIK